MRRFGIRALFLTSIALVPISRSNAAVHPDDAAVRSIQFVDEREGWAVGDDGIIWHSIDGGQTWERQVSGTRASLRAVHFLTPYTGWAVGRIELPGGDSRGIVLATTDGGLKWSNISNHPMPALNCVKFFSQRHGIAAGDGSDTYPTGVFTTIDGGQTWKAVPGKRCPTWLAADFVDADTGALGGPWSQLAAYRDGFFGAAEVDPLGGRSIKGMKLSGQFAVAVGQGGLILTSSKSAGLKWGFAVPSLQKDVLAACDFSAVALHGKHLWVVGRPGTFVLHSPDLGQSWEMQRTGQALPLHAIHFLNEKLGWAAGDMGTLLSTEDGGRTWKVVRQEAQRAAVLFVHAANNSTPLETIALIGEEEGYHTAALRFNSAAAPVTPPINPADDRPNARKQEATGSHPRSALDPEKLNAAMRYVGGSAGESMWQFPLPFHQNGCSAEQLIQHWDKLHGERSNTHILRQLVLAIRIWRPEVIVTDTIKTASPEQIILVEAVKEAFKLAADANAFPEQLTSLKLAAWSPKKLYTVCDKPDPAAVKIPLNEVKTRIGDCPRDFAQPATLFFGDTPAPVEQRCFQLIASRLPDAVGDSHLLQGIDLAYGGQARRDLPPLGEEAVANKAAMVKARQKREVLESIIAGKVTEFAKPEAALAQILPALKEMPGDQGARAVSAIAQQYANSGQWILARETFLMLVDKYPKHPLSLEAYRWLVRYQSSGEARRRQELGHFLLYTETGVEKADPSVPKGIVKGGTEIVQASHLVQLSDMEDARAWFKGSLAIEPRLQAFGPLYASDPAMQLCWHSSRRQLGEADAGKQWFSKYLSETAVPLGGQTVVRGADPWRDCAMAELWLANRNIGTSPAKPLAYGIRSEQRPHLDGKLDEACWQGVQPMLLTTTAGDLEATGQKNDQGRWTSDYTAKVWFAYDHENLYIAVHCTHPRGKRVPPVEKRSFDMDLRSFDRISILLDIDRDYQTYYHLQIDQRGCLAEDCWGDRSWNPKWYVAIASDETSWTAEAAITLSDLTGEKIMPGKAWAANATRIVPGAGVQAWSIPADAKPRPEGMGILQFIEKK